MTRALYNQMKTVALLVIIFFFPTCTELTQAQQSSRTGPSARDVALEIQRVDREQLLLLSPLPAKNSDAATRMAVLKKIKEDFKTLQAINNKMMTEVFATEEIDYAHTADMIGQVRSKAVSLKTNLSLPTDSDTKKTDSDARKVQSPSVMTSLKDLRAALMVLDQSIMSFVNNPLFQKPDVVDVTQAAQASRDLETVISFSADLQKLTSRLRKLPKQTR